MKRYPKRDAGDARPKTTEDTLTAGFLKINSEDEMKVVKKHPVARAVLTWSISVALSAGARADQVRYQATTLPLPEQTLQKPPQPQRFDEYGNIRLNDEKARLDNFAITLQNDPTSVAYIIGYGGSTCRVGEAMARANRAKDYLTNSRGVDAGRIIIRNGGYRSEVGAELYVVPLGGAEPPLRPTAPHCKKPRPTKYKNSGKSFV